MSIAFVASGEVLDMAKRLVAAVVPDAIVRGSFEELTPDLHRVEGLITGTAAYDRAAVALLRAKAPRLRWVQALSSGVDHHLEAGLPAGVSLTSGAGAHAPAVADHALALALSLLRKLPTFRAAAVNHQWVPGREVPKLRSLARARCLVLGYGAIGAAVVNRLLGFDARVTVATRTQIPLPTNVVHCALAEIDRALPDADIVFLCLPQAAETTEILSRQRLLAMPKGALVINVGRGGLIDEAALTEALATGHLGGAGLDVTTVEPLPADHQLWQLAEITPHVAGRGDLTFSLLYDIVAENLRRFAAGQDLINLAAIAPVDGSE